MARHRVSRPGRSHGPDAFGREAQNRTRVAQLAARFIVEHGLGDWALAKRKAARQLMLSEREALPGDDEVEAALVEHQALFGGDEQQASLRAKRAEALKWMRRLASFAPLLVGSVAAGWASEYSDVRIELTSDDAKAVELALINDDVPYRVAPGRSDDAPELYIDSGDHGVRLIIRTTTGARQRPRRDRSGNPEPRLDVASVERLLDEAPRG
jgi:hypothetical protein